MPIRDCFTHVSTFPDFNAPTVHVYATSARQAAEWVAAAWEHDKEDFRVIQVEETLRIRVESKQDVSLWAVLAEGGKHVAKAITQGEI